ncbi:hypothetical protein PENTCL1PPCAC_3494, partial [Pristionchus entomophagus]
LLLQKLSRSFIWRILAAQFAISLLTTAPVWPASYVYKNETTQDQIVALSPTHMLILKALSVITYLLYIVCNSIFTVLTSRELFRLRSVLEGNSATTQKIITQQRNIFIIVTVCSINHLLKALQQFAVAVTTYFGLVDLTTLIWSLYPLVNVLSTYSAPICLFLLSPTVRIRLLSPIIPAM